MPGELRVEGLHVARGGRLVLRGVSLQAREGEAAAVLGPNGAGKTTLLLAVAGALAPLKGLVVVGGRTVCRMPGGPCLAPEERRAVLVPQDLALFENMTVLDNIAFALEARGLGRAEARREARRIAEQLGLEELLDARPARLSGGQRQRVALARAVAAEPEALLLDEPLSSIDQASRWRLRRLIRRLIRETRVPTLIVTHSFADAWSMADRLYMLSNGRVEAEGPSRMLAEKPLTAGGRGVAEQLGYILLEAVRDPENPRLLHISGLGGLLVEAPQPPGRLLVAIRPDDPVAVGKPSGVNTYRVRVIEATLTRHAVRVTGEVVPGGLVLELEQPRGLMLALYGRLPRRGDTILIHIPPSAPDTIPLEGG